MVIRKFAFGLFAMVASVAYSATPRELIASALILEDAEDGTEGMWAVACVIKNRVELRHTDPVYEILRKKQFTSMKRKNPVSRARSICSRDQWATALHLADRVIEHRLPDITCGATHFCTVGAYPYWSYELPRVVTIGKLDYYREGLRIDTHYRADWMHLHPTFAAP